ncbi:hypothetical protein HK105_202058 [Polyrhizophydium stewartii]|uniref:UDENN domain-containing protein n=1 Tax=Polyrhizophydium stewartii TaxID=2732419 RepID=A0ABR4NF28_9FUNG
MMHQSDAGRHQPSQAATDMATSLTPPESNVEAVSPELVALLGPNASPMNEALLRLNLGSFWQWVFCFCLVNFDLELGQAIELIYPPIEFSETEKQTIAFSAFPDSNSSEHVGDSCFTFRIRNSNFCKRLYLKEHYPSSQQSSQQQNRSPQPALSTAPMAAESAAAVRGNVGLPVDTDGYTYGFVFFRQQVDKEVRRGYLQKSLVLLTPHPWPGLFLNVVSLLGPELMSSLVADRRTNARTQDPHAPAFQGMALLESACFNVASWPAPPSSLSPELSYFSTVLLLPFLGRALRYSFPPTPRFPQLHELPRQGAHEVITGGTDNLPPALCTPGNFYPLFESSPELLWTCWELMVIGEPIMVVGDTPRSCSELVWALVELIKPIPFGGDFRPYFTIQDSDNQHLTNRTRAPPPGTVLGVTNMVFTKLGSGGALHPHPRRDMAFSRESVIEAQLAKHKPFLSRDKRLLKDLIEAGAQGQPVQAINNMIRRHFTELTDRFLQPLNRYFESLVVGNPAQMTLSCLRSRPEIKPFRQDTFLRQIEQSVPSLPVSAKRPIPDLYRLFLKSPSFAAWLQHRTAEVGREWRQKYFDTICAADIDGWARARLAAHSDVECIDLLLRLRDELDKFSCFFVVEDNHVRYANVPGVPTNAEPSHAQSAKPRPVPYSASPSGAVALGSDGTPSGRPSSPLASGRRAKRRDQDFGVDITSLYNPIITLKLPKCAEMTCSAIDCTPT